MAEYYTNKENLMQLARELSIPCPETFSVCSFDELATIKEKLVYPCLIKPKRTHLFSNTLNVKLFVAKDYQELCDYLKRCFSVDCGGVTVQEFIPGPETNLVGIRFYVSQKGDVLAENGFIKSRQSPPNFGIVRVGKITIPVKEISDYCRKMVQHLHYTGMGHWEFKFDSRDNKYKLLDFNARPHMDIGLDIHAGIDKPYWLYEELVNHKNVADNKYEKDIYWINFVSDLRYFIKCWLLKTNRLERYSFAEYLRPYLSKNVFAVFDIKDPVPAVMEALYAFKFLLTKGI